MTKSDEVVARLAVLDTRIKRRGFQAAIRRISENSRYTAEISRRIVPDAYMEDAENFVMTIIEVVETSPITPGKGCWISELWDELDELGWSLMVRVYDYAGNLVASLPGYAYEPAYTSVFRAENCKDVTPAAIAVMRE